MTNNKYDFNQEEKRIINSDSLDEFEIPLGEKSNNLSNSLSLMLYMQKLQDKRKIYSSKGDTFLGSGLKNLHNNLLEHGYTIEVNEFFIRDSEYHEDQEDYFLIYAHDNGSIVFLDTYGKAFKIDSEGNCINDKNGNILYENDFNINSGNLIFQWEPNNGVKAFDILNGCSHSHKILYNKEKNENRYDLSNREIDIEKGYFYGNKDIREGLFNKINNLKNNGNFINKWMDNNSNYMYDINIPEDVALYIMKKEKDVLNEKDVKNFIINKSEKLKRIFNNNIDNIDVLGM